MLFPFFLLLLLSINTASGLANINPFVPQQVAATLLAPVYRNVTFGDVWVYPNSSFDLGARSMNCECFDPSEICCMPKSTAMAPFCTVQNTSCCANTYCLSGETCCGEFCCAADTTCNVKASGSGCCRKGEICDSSAACYDHATSECSNTAVPKVECCPVDAPYCRNLQPNGLGCYASPSVSTSSLPTASLPSTSINLGSLIALAQTSGTATVTISIVQNSNGMFLEIAPNTGVPDAATTTYVLEYPTSPSSATGNLITSTPLSTAATSLTRPSSSQRTTISDISVLCHNDDSKNPVPCQNVSANKTSKGSSRITATTSFDNGYLPPSTTVYHSQASKSTNPVSVVFSLVKRLFVAILRIVAGILDYSATCIEEDNHSFWYWFLIIFTLFAAIFVLRVTIEFVGCIILIENGARPIRHNISSTATERQAQDPKTEAAPPIRGKRELLLTSIQERIDVLALDNEASLQRSINLLQIISIDSILPTLQRTFSTTIQETHAVFNYIQRLIREDAIATTMTTSDNSSPTNLVPGSSRPLSQTADNGAQSSHELAAASCCDKSSEQQYREEEEEKIRPTVESPASFTDTNVQLGKNDDDDDAKTNANADTSSEFIPDDDDGNDDEEEDGDEDEDDGAFSDAELEVELESKLEDDGHASAGIGTGSGTKVDDPYWDFS